jgi:FkbM family methyltransferase
MAVMSSAIADGALQGRRYATGKKRNKMSPSISIPSHNLGDYTVPQDAHGGICVDIGANVGSFLAAHADKFDKVHFYEPYPPCYERCLEQARHSSAFIVGFNEAASDKDRAEVKLVAHANHDAGSSALQNAAINHHWGSEQIATCPSVSLETILLRVGGFIDFLKCDAETSEYDIFVEKDLSAIRYIALELHWQMGEQRWGELLNWLLFSHELQGAMPVYQQERNYELFFVRRSV